MAPVAILLLVADQGGALSLGGALCALYGLASTVGQPLLGRMVDRRGQTVITSTAVIVTTVCLMLLPTIDAAAQPGVAAALVAVAGLSTPPLEAGLRALWPQVLPDPERRRAALALDTGTQGLIFVAGPPLMVVLVAAAGPGIAMAASAVLGLVGAVAVVTAPPSLAWTPALAPATGSGGVGPLRHRGLLLLFIALTGVGFALGAMNVWAVAMADRYEMSLLSGLIPAALSTGSLVGGLLYGRRSWPGTVTTQLTVAAAAFATGWLPLVTGPGPVPATVLTALPGLFLTALITSAFLTVDRLAPAGTTTEAYAWLIASVGVGQAAGTALAGATAADPFTDSALPAAGALACLSVLVAAHRRIAPASAIRQRGRHRRVPAHAAHP